MDLKTVAAGITAPLTKLIEVCSIGIGAVARPWLMSRDTKALIENVKLLEAEGFLLTKTSVPGLPGEVISRVAHQEAKRQRNLAGVVDAAKHALPENVSADPVDEDFVNRFFTAAQDVSKEQMQQIWGRLLAGEVAKPGTFSLRTLDCLRNLTSDDVRTFSDICELAFSDGNAAYLITPAPIRSAVVRLSGPASFVERIHKIHAHYRSRGLEYDQFAQMAEAGLLSNNLEAGVTVGTDSPSRFEATFVVNGVPLVLTHPDPHLEFSLPIVALTSIGRELHCLHVPARDRAFEQILQAALEASGFHVSWGVPTKL